MSAIALTKPLNRFPLPIADTIEVELELLNGRDSKRWATLSPAEQKERVDKAAAKIRAYIDRHPHAAVLHMNLLHALSRTPTTTLGTAAWHQPIADSLPALEAAMRQPQVWPARTIDGERMTALVQVLNASGARVMAARITAGRLFGLMRQLKQAHCAPGFSPKIETELLQHPENIYAHVATLNMSESPERALYAEAMADSAIALYPGQVNPHLAAMCVLNFDPVQRRDAHDALREHAQAIAAADPEKQIWSQGKDRVAMQFYAALSALDRHNLSVEARQIMKRFDPILRCHPEYGVAGSKLDMLMEYIDHHAQLPPAGRIDNTLRRLRRSKQVASHTDDQEYEDFIQKLELNRLDHAIDEFPGQVVLMVEKIDTMLQGDVIDIAANRDELTELLEGIRDAVDNTTPQHKPMRRDDARSLFFALINMHRHDLIDDARALLCTVEDLYDEHYDGTLNRIGDISPEMPWKKRRNEPAPLINWGRCG